MDVVGLNMSSPKVWGLRLEPNFPGTFMCPILHLPALLHSLHPRYNHLPKFSLGCSLPTPVSCAPASPRVLQTQASTRCGWSASPVPQSHHYTLLPTTTHTAKQSNFSSQVNSFPWKLPFFPMYSSANSNLLKI